MTFNEHTAQLCFIILPNAITVMGPLKQKAIRSESDLQVGKVQSTLWDRHEKSFTYIGLYFPIMLPVSSREGYDNDDTNNDIG